MRALIIILSILPASIAIAGGTVQLEKRTVVRSSVIRLGDIATVRGLDGERRARLKRVKIGQSPAVGQSKYIPRSYIERRITDAVGAGLRIIGSARIEVKRRGTMLRGAWLAQRLRAAIETRLPYSIDEVAALDIPRIPDCRVPEGSTIRVTFEPGEQFRGHALVSLVVEDNGKKVISRRVNVKIDRYTTLLGAAADLRRGQTISRADLVSIRIAKSKAPKDSVQRPEFVEGSEVRRTIKAGDVIRQAWFKIPPVIARGDRVRVIAKRGAVQLSTFGQALNNATQHAFVRVRNMGSKKIVTGRAIGPGVVEMEF
jgi:flagella basal body P-ring formation protein FlgA